MSFFLTGDPQADELLARDDNALLAGMCLDQQIAMEKAFSGPAVIASRMGGSFDVGAIAALPVDGFVAICAERPAVHRFPGSMGARLHQLCTVLVDEYAGDAARIWSDGSGPEILRRLRQLPGFGEQKAQIFLTVLGKQRGLQADGWREAAGEYGIDGFRSVADITDAESLARVRESKKAAKAAARAGRVA